MLIFRGLDDMRRKRIIALAADFMLPASALFYLGALASAVRGDWTSSLLLFVLAFISWVIFKIDDDSYPP